MLLLFKTGCHETVIIDSSSMLSLPERCDPKLALLSSIRPHFQDCQIGGVKLLVGGGSKISQN